MIKLIKNLFPARKAKDQTPQPYALDSFLKTMYSARHVLWCMPANHSQEGRLISGIIESRILWENGGYVVSSAENLNAVRSSFTDHKIPVQTFDISTFQDFSSICPIDGKTPNSCVFIFVDNESSAPATRIENGNTFWKAFFRMMQEERLRNKVRDDVSDEVVANFRRLPLLSCSPLTIMHPASSVHAHSLRDQLFTVLISTQTISHIKEYAKAFSNARLIDFHYSLAANSVRLFGCTLQSLEDVKHAVDKPVSFSEYCADERIIEGRSIPDLLIKNSGREIRGFELGRNTECHAFFKEGSLVVKLTG